MTGCIFCAIAAGDVPAKFLYQDDKAVAVADLNPQAPVHLLVLPREHIVSLAETSAGHAQLLGHLLAAAQTVARQQGLAEGFRVVINTGPDGGQTVGHLHLHVLGGRQMHWPPG